MYVGNKFTKIRKLKNEDILLNLDYILSNIINTYYNMFNIGNYFEIFKQYFYRNKKDEYIILLNLKDKIINIFNKDQHNEIYITLIDLFLYQDKEFEFIEFLMDKINDCKSKYNNFNVIDYTSISKLILDKILNNIRKNIDEYYIECYNEMFNRDNDDENDFILNLYNFIMIYTKFRFIFYSNTIFNYT